MYYSELQKGIEVAGRYVLKECKGSGSFGEVWLAEDKVLGIDVAIKLYISLDQKGQNEFKDEYKVAYGLNHQYLLTTQFYGVWEHRPYLIMKYCSQGSAATLAGSISEYKIWKFIHDVASGLEYLHAQNPPIIHQDIKPANILIDEQGNFLITDFGISKKMRTTMRKQFKRAMESGAIAYMGPERFLANPMAVMASDIWSLGVSVYELATDELPFMGQGGGMLNAGASMPVLESQWSRNLNDVVQRCLAKETFDRPFAQDLAAYADLMLKGENLSWEEWKKRGGKTPKPKKKFYWVVAALLVVAGGIWWFVSDGISKEQTAIKQRYAGMKLLCENNIKVGSPENYAALLEAQSLIDSMKQFREKYDYLEEDPQCAIGTEEQDLSEKIEEAQKAWIRSAKGQYEIAEDVGAAISHYHIAATLKTSAEVTKALTNIASQDGCKGAYMVVNSWRLVDNELLISYDGLNDSPISMPVEYELSAQSGGNKIKGRANMQVDTGKGRLLFIKIDELNPAIDYNHLTLNSNNIRFFSD